MSKANRNRRISARLAKAATSTAGRPSFLKAPRLDLRELDTAPLANRALVNRANQYLRAYTLGECSVIVTREYGRWHLSIAHRHRDPTWAEIAEARYRLMPIDCTAALILPPLDQYVNINTHCFQIKEIAAEAEGES